MGKGVLKVCDFGLARHYGEPLRAYTQRVVSLWYRAPELLMGQRHYTTSIDIWSVGCVFAELLLRRPAFEGRAELHQLQIIYELTGVPTEDSWPGYDRLPNRKAFHFKLCQPKWRVTFPESGDLSDLGLEMLQSLLELCPNQRASAVDAQRHQYFHELPHAQDPKMMPTFYEVNSEGRERRVHQGGPQPPAKLEAE